MTDQNTNIADSTDEKEHTIGPTDSDIHDIEDALHSEHDDAVIEAMGELSPADAAEVLTKLSDEDCQKILEDHSAVLDPQVYSELDPEFRRSMLTLSLIHI